MLDIHGLILLHNELYLYYHATRSINKMCLRQVDISKQPRGVIFLTHPTKVLLTHPLSHTGKQTYMHIHTHSHMAMDNHYILEAYMFPSYIKTS